jgi:hypothetical protein
MGINVFKRRMKKLLFHKEDSESQTPHPEIRNKVTGKDKFFKLSFLSISR